MTGSGSTRALAEKPQRPQELAERTGTTPRYVEEWLRGLPGAFQLVFGTLRAAGRTTLVTTFDCLHHMGDPLRAARHIRESLGSAGAWMIVESYAGDTVADNLNPVGRIYGSARPQRHRSKHRV